ncbi:unnamed protein product [Rotaria sordida]|uniref:Uncharacterized protein n=2 Tax=Rotaria sordida TaxID=392033 RepID=A0A814N0T1_9BILA|nr:unnamed protein product [Rotaria sordida]
MASNRNRNVRKNDRFIPTHDATIFDTYVADIQVDGKTIDLALFDTAGQEDFDRLRPLSYPDTSVVLICFSADSPVSATSVIEKWIPEVRHFCGQCPVILVACKKDLRRDPQTIAKLKQDGERPVTTDVGRQIAMQIKADAYMECSAKTREGVQELFVHAAHLSLKRRHKKRRGQYKKNSFNDYSFEMATNRNSSIQKSRKLVVVGDGMSGKTCLLFAFKDDEFNTDHIPTVFDTYVAEIEVDGNTVDLALFDTAGQEDFDRLRPLSYPDTNVIIMCFSVDNPVSAASITEKWIPEVRHFCGTCPIILVACKIDLRTDSQVVASMKTKGQKLVSIEVGKQLATQIKADGYMECSAKTREGIHDLFILAARLSLKKRNHHKKHHKCFVI